MIWQHGDDHYGGVAAGNTAVAQKQATAVRWGAPEQPAEAQRDIRPWEQERWVQFLMANNSLRLLWLLEFCCSLMTSNFRNQMERYRLQRNVVE